MIRFPKPGERVKFQDGQDVLVGICNGGPLSMDENQPTAVTHLPVYVRDGDRCMVVAAGNIIEWPES